MSEATVTRTRPKGVRYTHAEWLHEAERRFGKDPLNWRFVCPACGHVASVKDWRDAGAPEGAIGFSCVGRWKGLKRDAFGLNPVAVRRGELPPAEGPGPCNYTGAGLFAINPIEVVAQDGQVHHTFAFAEEPRS